jgi:hypothetical protein
MNFFAIFLSVCNIFIAFCGPLHTSDQLLTSRRVPHRRVSTPLNAQVEDFRGLSLRRERSVERGVGAGFPSGNPSPPVNLILLIYLLPPLDRNSRPDTLVKIRLDS